MIQLSNECLSVWIDENKGSSIRGLNFHNTEILCKEEKYAGFLMAPFVNRIENGTYTFNGKYYQLPINDQAKNNSIHGFLRDFKFEIVDLSSNFCTTTYTHNKDTTPYYPFDFKITITFKLSENRFSLKTNVENLSNYSIPFSLGWHPYFTLNCSSINQMELKLNAKNRFHLNERMIPIKTFEKYSNFKTTTQIENTIFDDCFSLEKKNVHLINKESGLSVNVRFCDQYQYLQLYTPQNRNSIAIEPMTSIGNSFNNRIGLKTIAPHNSFEANFEIVIDSIN
jgi:aldose 1-epimerase